MQRISASVIQSNRIVNNYIGVGAISNRVITIFFSENTIANNDKGIEIDYSKSRLYNNNIIGNGIQMNVYTTTLQFLGTMAILPAESTGVTT
jgi:parallel beta-helix repeat protein